MESCSPDLECVISSEDLRWCILSEHSGEAVLQRWSTRCRARSKSRIRGQAQDSTTPLHSRSISCYFWVFDVLHLPLRLYSFYCGGTLLGRLHCGLVGNADVLCSFHVFQRVPMDSEHSRSHDLEVKEITSHTQLMEQPGSSPPRLTPGGDSLSSQMGTQGSSLLVLDGRGHTAVDSNTAAGLFFYAHHADGNFFGAAFLVNLRATVFVHVFKAAPRIWMSGGTIVVGPPPSLPPLLSLPLLSPFLPLLLPSLQNSVKWTVDSGSSQV